VAIHPFPNGNGRFSRLVGDLLARQLERPVFTWGRISLVDAGATRRAYVEALRAADANDIAPLLVFARS
jgi:Fic family protein